MSLTIETSPKHCAQKKTISLHRLKNLNPKLLLTLLSLLLFISLLFFLILRPSKPRFHLRQLSLLSLSLSPKPLPRLLNTSIHATIISYNPNSHVSIYYALIRSRAFYAGQQITPQADLPDFFQGSGESNFLTVSLEGVAFPVAGSVGDEIARDEAGGKVGLSVWVNGEMRWRVGKWVSRRYRFDVRCEAEMRFGGDFMGMGSLDGAECGTTV